MLATIYDSPIYQTIYALWTASPFVYVNAIGCIVLIVVFALYAFSREGRDEHGRASSVVPVSGDFWRSSS